MSRFSCMYLIPKETYNQLMSNGNRFTKDALSAGPIRQINNLEVQDGGRVVIRNDDHYKQTTGPSVPYQIPDDGEDPRTHDTTILPPNVAHQQTVIEEPKETDVFQPQITSSPTESQDLLQTRDLTQRLRNLVDEPQVEPMDVDGGDKASRDVDNKNIQTDAVEKLDRALQTAVQTSHIDTDRSTNYSFTFERLYSD